MSRLLNVSSLPAYIHECSKNVQCFGRICWEIQKISFIHHFSYPLSAINIRVVLKTDTITFHNYLFWNSWLWNHDVLTTKVFFSWIRLKWTAKMHLLFINSWNQANGEYLGMIFSGISLSSWLIRTVKLLIVIIQPRLLWLSR